MADLTRLPAILRAAGLKVVEISGWQGRGRPGSYDPGGMLIHHTAGKGDGLADATSMAKVGRPDLNPPLCQLALDRQGVWYVCAAGRSNHAGRCRPIGGLRTYGDGRPYGDGNAQLIGVEVQNDGTEPFPTAQYDSLVRGTAAITKAYRWRPPLGHKETSIEGKPDPHFPMDPFRRDVATTNPQEDDMSMTDKVVESKMLGPNEQMIAIPRSLELMMRWTLETRDNSIVTRKLAEQQAKLGRPMTDDEVKAAVKEALSEAAQIEVVVRPQEPTP